jgi:hypothetical protein
VQYGGLLGCTIGFAFVNLQNAIYWGQAGSE